MVKKNCLFDTAKVNLALIFWAAIALFGLLAFQYYQYESRSIREKKHEELSVIADSKHNQIVSWHNERLGVDSTQNH